MQKRTPASFSAPKRDAIVVVKPNRSWRARDANLTVDHVAQASQVGLPRMRVRFATTTDNGLVTPAWGAAEWGSASADLPSILRTDVGTYEIRPLATATPTPGQWTNSLGEIEVVSF